MSLHVNKRSIFRRCFIPFCIIIFFIHQSFIYPEIGLTSCLSANRNDSFASVPGQLESNLALPYFPLVYTGNGVDHMNINIVNLNSSGLKSGDEIGVFDGKYCVGAKVVEDKNFEENNLSIPSSANDTVESNPNGYIQGHKISLKAYRNGTVFLLYFETVNNSQDIFEKGGSMFAFIDFSLSTGQSTAEQSEEIKIFPNPFNGSLSIEIYLPYSHYVKCEILDLNGQLVSMLFNGEAAEQINIIWNGTDSNNQQVPSGMYICKVNETSVQVLYNKLDDR